MELRPRRHLASAVVLVGVAGLVAACHSAAPAPRADAATGAPAGVREADWKAAGYAAAGCAPRDAWLADGLPAAEWDDAAVTTTFADVTDDGRPEALVALACPAAVSVPPQRVVVLDLSAPDPRPLGVLGGELYFQTVQVAPGAGTVTLRGSTVGPDDPVCCPTHEGAAVHRWTGKAFAVDSVVETPVPVAGGELAALEGTG